jgi:virulence-associated protein VagC
MNGNCQAVRLSRKLRLDTARAETRRTSEGDLPMHPPRASRGEALLEAFANLDADFAAVLEAGRDERPP